jgi:hypothetical protein
MSVSSLTHQMAVKGISCVIVALLKIGVSLCLKASPGLVAIPVCAAHRPFETPHVNHVDGIICCDAVMVRWY